MDDQRGYDRLVVAVLCYHTIEHPVYKRAASMALATNIKGTTALSDFTFSEC